MPDLVSTAGDDSWIFLVFTLFMYRECCGRVCMHELTNPTGLSHLAVAGYRSLEQLFLALPYVLSA
jgi:hypothetical protein